MRRFDVIYGAIWGVIGIAGAAALTALDKMTHVTPATWKVILLISITAIVLALVNLVLLFVFSHWPSDIQVWPSLLINLGTCLIVWGVVWHFSFPRDVASSSHSQAPQVPYIFFRADIDDPKNIAALDWPLVVGHTGPKPFSSIDSWFSPAEVRGDAHDERYWSLRHLKVVRPGLMHTGAFWTGLRIPHGYYRIEYHGVYEGLSLSFVELLEIKDVNGEVVQLIDIWKRDAASQTKIFSSERPANLQDNRTP